MSDYKEAMELLKKALKLEPATKVRVWGERTHPTMPADTFTSLTSTKHPHKAAESAQKVNDTLNTFNDK